MSEEEKSLAQELRELRGQSDQTQKELELVKRRQDEIERRVQVLTLELNVQQRDFK